MMVPADLISIRNVLANPYKYYTYDQVEQFMARFDDYGFSVHMDYDPDLRKKRRVEYVELVASFDIETTSYEMNGRKYAWMYIWMFSIQGITIVGRTWKEYMDLSKRIHDQFHLSDSRRFVVYVHNLPFEFQFFCKIFGWEDVFALKSHGPIRANSVQGIQYRCSYALTGLPLGGITVPDDTVAGSVPKLPERYRYRIHKMLGDLDYSKIRHQHTPLTEEEMRYCVADVVTVCHIIADRLHDYGDTIASIPLTKTMYVRRAVRNNTSQQKGTTGAKYRKLMGSLTLDPHVYHLTKSAFQGGYTHANAEWVGVTCYDIMSMDITSAYPTAMVAEMFPITKFLPCGYTDPERYKGKALLITVTLHNVESKAAGDHGISVSACINEKQITRDPYTIIDNGRIVRCKQAKLTMTDVDWEYLPLLYTYETEIHEMYYAEKGYLPTALVSQILEYYAKKTTLKGVKGEERNYAMMKEFINSIYGMSATDIVREINEYIDGEGWSKYTPDVDDSIDKTNKNKSRFLFYCWAPWVTAYTRKRIIEAIAWLGALYHYTDTDSIKCENCKEARDYFESENKKIIEKLEKAVKHHGLSLDLIYPENQKGEICPLGIWDEDGVYTRFKTLGAKRYMYEALEEIEVDEYDEDGPTGRKIKTGWYEKVIHTTVAGVSKPYLAAYLSAQDDPFDAFDDDLVLPAEWNGYKGKPVHTYIDEEDTLTVTDYLGNTAEVHTYGGVHLANSEYHLNLAYDPEMIAAFLFGGGLDIVEQKVYD